MRIRLFAFLAAAAASQACSGQVDNGPPGVDSAFSATHLVMTANDRSNIDYWLDDAGRVVKATGTGRDGIPRTLTLHKGLARDRITGHEYVMAKAAYHEGDHIVLTVSSSMDHVGSTYVRVVNDRGEVFTTDLDFTHWATTRQARVTSTFSDGHTVKRATAPWALEGALPAEVVRLSEAFKSHFLQGLTSANYFAPLLQSQIDAFSAMRGRALVEAYGNSNPSWVDLANSTLTPFVEKKTIAKGLRATIWGLGGGAGAVGSYVVGTLLASNPIGWGAAGILGAIGFVTGASASFGSDLVTDWEQAPDNDPAPVETPNDGGADNPDGGTDDGSASVDETPADGGSSSDGSTSDGFTPADPAPNQSLPAGGGGGNTGHVDVEIFDDEWCGTEMSCN
jgi:hypothetical protein